MTTQEFKMDVVMPHLNYEGVRKSLESLRKHTPSENLGMVIFIDQNPEYQKVDDLVDLHIFTHGRNLGYSKCFNTGCRLSDEKFIMLVNDDVEFINKRWVNGVVETFNKYETALCVNPSSPRNPRASGEEPINAPGIEYKEEFTEEDYDKFLEIGGGHVIDGICMFATVFRRDKLDKIAGTIPGKCWFDEWFYPGAAEDYDMNRRAYLTKNEDNNLKGYRCLGTGLSYIFHWWYQTRKVSDGQKGVKYNGEQWYGKWNDGTSGEVDLYGKKGKQEIPINIIRPFQDCI